MMLLGLILSVGMLFFLPGLPLVLRFYGGRSFWVSAYYAIVLNALIMILLGSILAISGRFDAFNIWITACILSFIIWALCGSFKLSFWPNISKYRTGDLWHDFFVLLALLITFLMIFGIHGVYGGDSPAALQAINPMSADGSWYAFPFHADEWAHLARVKDMIGTHAISTNHPYLTNRPHTDFEAGFHIYWGEFFILTESDPLTSTQYLPALMTCLAALGLYSLSTLLSENRTAGVFSMIFLAGLPSNINLQGFWFWTPSSFSAVFLLGTLCLHEEWMQKGGRLRMCTAAITYIALFLVYPPAFLLSVIIVLIRHGISGSKAERRVVFISFAALVIALVVVETRVYSIFFDRNWARVNETYSPMMRFGLIGALTAIIGYLGYFKDALAERRKRSRDFSMSVMDIWMILALSGLGSFAMFGMTPLVPYPRLYIYFLIAVCFFSGSGLGFIQRHITKSLADRGVTIKSSMAVSAIFSVLVLGAYVCGYEKITQEYLRPQKYMSAPEYDALLYLKSIGSDHTVLANDRLSFAVYPVASDKVVGLTYSYLGGGDTKAWENFKSGNCSVKYYIASKGGIEYIVTADNIDCEGFREVYSGVEKVYEFEK